MNKKSAFSAILILVECFLWGVGNVIISVTLKTMPTFFCLAIRTLIAAILFLAFFRERIFSNIKKYQILPCLFIAAATTVSFLSGMFSLKYTSPTTSSFLISISVIFTPFFAYFITHTKISYKIILPIILIIVGLFYLCGGDVKFKFGFGELMGILCSVSYGLSLALSSKYIRGIDSVVVSVFQTGFAAIFCFIAGFIFEDFTSLLNLPSSNWYAVVFLAVGCTFIAFSFQNIALKHLNSTYVSVLFCTESVFTALCAYFMIGEVLTVTGIIGATFILVGIVIASLIGNKVQNAT